MLSLRPEATAVTRRDEAVYRKILCPVSVFGSSHQRAAAEELELGGKTDDISAPEYAIPAGKKCAILSTDTMTIQIDIMVVSFHPGKA